VAQETHGRILQEETEGTEDAGLEAEKLKAENGRRRIGRKEAQEAQKRRLSRKTHGIHGLHAASTGTRVDEERVMNWKEFAG